MKVNKSPMLFWAFFII